jgi:hypothetical protein
MASLCSRTLVMVFAATVASLPVFLPALAQTASSEAPTSLALPPLDGPLVASPDIHARSAHRGGLKLDRPVGSQDMKTAAEASSTTTIATAAPQASSSPLMGAGPPDTSRMALGGNVLATGTH